MAKEYMLNGFENFQKIKAANYNSSFKNQANPLQFLKTDRHKELYSSFATTNMYERKTKKM